MTRPLILIALVGLLNGCVVDRSGTRLDGGDASARMDGGPVPEAGQIDAGTDGGLPDGSVPDGAAPDDGGAPDGGAPDGGCDAEGDIRCAADGSALETCGGDGRWTMDAPCDHGCETGECLSACDGTDVTTLMLDDPVTVDLCEETDDFQYGTTHPNDCTPDLDRGKDRLFRVDVPSTPTGQRYCVRAISGVEVVLHQRSRCADPDSQLVCYVNNDGNNPLLRGVWDAGSSFFVILDSIGMCGTAEIEFTAC